MLMRMFDLQDKIVLAVEKSLETILSPNESNRPYPAENIADISLDKDRLKKSRSLMRVNHAGEIAAQALYNGQAVFARSEETIVHLEKSAEEEKDHLAWCAKRIDELEGKRSLLDPFWYLGSFPLGLVVGLTSDQFSLGFIAETEEQVGKQIKDHINKMPKDDLKSQAILKQMAEDEAEHGSHAKNMGGVKMPHLLTKLMSIGGEILRKVAYKI